MENDQNRTNLIMIIVLLATILLTAIFIVSHRIVDEKDEKKTSDDNEVLESDTSVDDTLYKSYEIGDGVFLLDSSSWHVIEKSSQEKEEVTLLKDKKLTTELKQEEAKDFLATNYLKLLKDNLGALSSDIKQIRLLTLEDIKTILKTDAVELGTSLEKEGLEWLYQEQTLIDGISSNQLPLLVCNREDKEENESSICEGKDQEIWSVRPVVTISKEYIKE